MTRKIDNLIIGTCISILLVICLINSSMGGIFQTQRVYAQEIYRGDKTDEDPVDIVLDSTASNSQLPGNNEWQSSEFIEVKFVDGTSFRVRDGDMVSLKTDDLTGLERVLLDHPVQTVDRLFSQPEEQMAVDIAALEASENMDLPDLNLWFRMQVAEGTNLEDLVNALNALPEVETAYPAPLPAPPPSYSVRSPSVAPLLTADYTAGQNYLDPGTSGIDAIYAWTLSGGTGNHVTIVDIEYGFHSTHEDLPSISVIGGQIWAHPSDPNNDHGTAVLGELVALNNGYGVTGIAYGGTAAFSSPCFDSSCSTYNPANAIDTARTNTVAGDVILIEQQTNVCGLGMYGPLEWYGSVYDATLVATTAGRIVVAAAGNGNNVDTGVDLDGAGCLGFFDRSLWDSGAIIVGAGAPPPPYPQTDRSKLGYSSYGSRVDLQGYGAWVTTTGYGDLGGIPQNEWYTDYFSGTSSASPIVAGAAALLSSVSQQNGVVLTPRRIRSTLVLTGSPQQAHSGFPISENIGPRPDLLSALSLDSADIVGFYDPATKIWRMRTGNTWSDSVNYLVWGPNGGGWTPVTGDWDNDGVDEVGFFDPATKIWRMRTGNTWSDSVNYLVWGPNGGGWTPVTGDWDNDGVDEVGFYDPATKIWRMRTGNIWSDSVDYLVWGPNGGGWTPVTGDWDGDGIDEVGFYDPVTKIWRMRTGNTWSDSVNYLVWGPNGGGWTPVTGDWDGNGIDEVGFYDPVTKVWRMRTGNTWSDSVNYLVWGPGGGGWTPVSGNW